MLKNVHVRVVVPLGENGDLEMEVTEVVADMFDVFLTVYLIFLF